MEDKELVEDIARGLQRQHSKEMLGSLQKWEKITPHERSTWRLIARTTIATLRDKQSGAPKKKKAEA